MIGHILEGYNVVDRIKDGSVGEIWLAGKDKKMFALKVLFEKHMESSDKKKKFRREAKIARGLDHPSVIRTFEYHSVLPRPFYVMEYFPSVNLKAAILDGTTGLGQKKLTILRQVAEALNYIHGQKVVHRDIKPENILVAKNGAVKLIDFSLAQTPWDRLTGLFTKSSAGSPSYMPPEQIAGKKVDARADYSSLGILAFELLAGRLPFIGQSMQEVLELHVKGPVPNVRELEPRVPLDVATFIASLMSKSPDKRPGSLSDFIYVLGKREVEPILSERARPRRRGPA